MLDRKCVANMSKDSVSSCTSCRAEAEGDLIFTSTPPQNAAMVIALVAVSAFVSGGVSIEWAELQQF